AARRYAGRPASPARPSARRRPAAPRAPGASQHLGVHQQVVSLSIEIRDRALQPEAGLLVETPGAPLPLQAGRLDADDARAALLQLLVDRGDQRAADATAARALADHQPVE